ncbi:hypothetical protein FOCC_FOCC006263, partial [Frankliniella occidentalis]
MSLSGPSGLNKDERVNLRPPLPLQRAPRRCSIIPGVEKTKWVHYDDPAELVGVIKATPPWDTVILQVEEGPAFVAFTDEASCSSPRKIFMKVPTMEHSLKIWMEVAREAKKLSINEDYSDFWRRPVDQTDGRENGLDQILAYLPEARSLKSLAMYVGEFTTDFTWPQKVVLPHLTKLNLVRTQTEEDLKNLENLRRRKRQPNPPPSSSRFTSAAVFESLLRAHSEQLIDVAVQMEQLPRLIGALPQNIPQLSITHKSSPVAHLRVTHGNKLDIRFLGENAKHAELVARAVLSWTGPRRCLTLHNVPSPETVSLLRGCETHSLVLDPPPLALMLRDPPASTMPNLSPTVPARRERWMATGLMLGCETRSLVLDPAPSLQVLRDLPADAIPALCLITLVCHRFGGSTQDKTSHCSSEQRVPVCREAILADLVLRAPRSLHVISHCAKGGGSEFNFAPYLLGRHGESEVESCTVCAEAQIPNGAIYDHLYPLPYVRVEQDE